MDDRCGARWSTAEPVLVVEAREGAAPVHLAVFSHDRRWASMRLVQPDGTSRCIAPVPSAVEVGDRVEERTVLAINAWLSPGRWEVWLGTDIDRASLDPSPVPLLIAPLARVAEADWEERIRDSLATDPHVGGISWRAQRWAPAESVFDPATARVRTTWGECYRMFIRYDLSSPPPVSLVLQRVTDDGEPLSTPPHVVSIDARAAFTVGEIDFCADIGPTQLTAMPAGSAAPSEVRVFSTPRDTAGRDAAQWMNQQPEYLCTQCQGSLRHCLNSPGSRQRCRTQFRTCLRTLHLDASSCPPAR